MSDDMGYSDIGCYGGSIDTPVLDNLAKRPTLYSILQYGALLSFKSGFINRLYQHQAGIGHMVNDHGNDIYNGDLSQNAVTIAEVLQKAGYTTYMSGKWHVTPSNLKKKIRGKVNWPVQRGFDRFFWNHSRRR